MADLITIIGVGASICTASASIPQLIKIAKSKSAGDISKLMVAVLIVGLGLWVYYGFLKSDVIILTANAIPFMVNLSILILSFKYNKEE